MNFKYLRSTKYNCFSFKDGDKDNIILRNQEQQLTLARKDFFEQLKEVDRKKEVPYKTKNVFCNTTKYIKFTPIHTKFIVA